MSPADLDLARKLAAHPRWEWCERMRNVVGWTYLGEGVWATDLDEVVVGPPPVDGSGEVSPPDLDDPAVAGVLLAMLQESLSDDVFAHTGRGGQVGAVVSWMPWMGQRFEGATLASAAARALLAAWGPA